MLELLGYVDLPAHHAKSGGFDHAAVHGGRHRLYVAHTANDALDVIDCATQTYVRSIPDLPGVVGALAPGVPVERWDDVPAVSENYHAARDVIVSRLPMLLASATRDRSA